MAIHEVRITERTVCACITSLSSRNFGISIHVMTTVMTSLAFCPESYCVSVGYIRQQARM